MRTYPLIIKFEEKHSDDCYIVNNDIEYYKVFFQKLKNRFEMGWYAWMKNYEDEKINQEYNLIVECINENNHKNAYNLINMFSDGEYENYEIITPSQIK